MTSADLAVPEGFQRHQRASPISEPWEPLYARMADDILVIGLRAARPHTNSRGFVHGGLISALSDNAMGLNCSRRVGDGASMVTVNLSVDFLGPAQVGQWLAFETAFVKVGGTLCFAQAFVTADGEPCARANAVFRVVRRKAA